MTKEENKWTYEEWTSQIADTGDYDSGVRFTNGKDTLHSHTEDLETEDFKQFCEYLDMMPDLWSEKMDALEFENSQLIKEKAHLTAENQRLKEALEVCSKSLATYGNHPIIEKIVSNALAPKTEYKICTDCGTKFSSNQRCPECNPME